MKITENTLSNIFSFEEEDEVIEERSVQKKLTIFDYLKDICYLKKGNLPETRDFEMKVWNSFMILRYLSLNKKFLPIINIFNIYQAILTPKELYKSLVIVLPKNNAFLKYPKLHKMLHKDKHIDNMVKYFKCTKDDAVEYLNLGLISDVELKQIEEKLGGRIK